MNSEYEQKYLAAKEELKTNIEVASKVTPCVMITEQNWSAMVRAVRSMEKLMEHTVTTEAMKDYMDQLNALFKNKAEWLESKDRAIATELQVKTELIKSDLEKQAGNQKEEYASALEKSRKTLEADFKTYTDKMFKWFLIPCLLLILLSVVLVLLQILGR